LLAALAAGCQTQQKPQSTSSVLDVSAPLPRDNNVRPMTGYQPAPGPYAASPTPATTSTPPYMLPSAYPPPEPAPAMTVVEAQPPAAVPAAATAKASGSRYTVKQGDTLYHIAKVRYGNGNQWQRIVSANPGVSPSALKVGQVLVVP
jgi:nucleoid-associated protein YgaU